MATTASQTDAEDVIAQTFADLLLMQAEDLDPESDFFEVGGDSILAGRAIVRLRSLFPATRISIRDLFNAPTPRALAEVIAGRPRTPGG